MELSSLRMLNRGTVDPHHIRLPACAVSIIVEFLSRPLQRHRLGISDCHTAAIHSGGSVFMHGFRWPPVFHYEQVLAATSVAVAVGYSHMVSLTNRGDILCCGLNSYHQCEVPSLLPRAVLVSAGEWHTVVVTERGDLVCFGANCKGQCDVPPRIDPVVQQHLRTQGRLLFASMPFQAFYRFP